MVQEAVIQTPTSSTAPRAIINYIHGGAVNDKHSSKRQRQRLLSTTFVREQVNYVQRSFSKGSVRPIDDIVTFSPVDANQVLQSHEDALLLTLGIYGFDVKRILVYPGSSVDLLQMSVYKQMRYSPSTLENPGCLLPGFKGATTTSLGDVVLPIQTGPVILNVWFSMVDDLSLYNVIMGRAWLYIMKFIPSTYHQMVSYLTEEGQVDLLGSQLATR